jgi:uncharacterized protein (DUF736 family)
MIIGKFTSKDDGQLEGFLDTISGDVGLKFTPNTKGANYTVTTDNGCEAGAAWKRTTNDGKDYVSVRLDSPFLPAPINCALFVQKDGSYVLVWDRMKPKDE